MPATSRKTKKGKGHIRQTIARNEKWIICITAALVLTLIFGYMCFSLAKEIRDKQKMRGDLGYASDECWYVSSSRNILREVFGAQPSYVDSNGWHNYTIFFPGWNDRVSSLKVSGTVTLYEHIDYGGASITFKGDVPSLVDYGWNDRASSLKVTGSVTLYEDENYGGTSITFISDVKNLDSKYSEKENFTNFVEEELGGKITVSSKYTQIAAISIAVPEELDYKNLLETFPQIQIIQRGFNYPDTERVGNYLNEEHPPLVKYIIGFSMLTLGDEPMNWRLPGIIAGSLTILLVYLIVAKLTNNGFVSLFVFLFAFTDPVIRAMSSIAMLDIYLAFFVTLSMWLALRKNYFLSAISIGLATACKLSGLFVAPALFLFMIYHKKPSFSGPLKTKLVQFIRRLADPRPYFYAFVIPLLILFISDLPFVARFGWDWLGRNFPGNVSWFLTSKSGGSGPWGWFVNQSPFTLHFGPDISASVNPVIYFMALISLIFVPYLVRKINRDYLVPSLWFCMSFLGFTLVYLLGNRSQYSFYVVALSPMVYVLACVLVYYLIKNAIVHIKSIVPTLKNPKAITQIGKHPKSKIRKFLKIRKSAGSSIRQPRAKTRRKRSKNVAPPK